MRKFLFLLIFLAACAPQPKLMDLSADVAAIELDQDRNGAIDEGRGGLNASTYNGMRVNLNVEDGATNGASVAQASAISANTAKTGITAQQAASITTNNAKISYTASAAVAANTSKVSYTDAGVVATALQPGDVGTAAMLHTGIITGSIPIYEDDGQGNPSLPIGEVINASGFNGNLATTDDTFAEVAQKVEIARDDAGVDAE